MITTADVVSPLVSLVSQPVSRVERPKAAFLLDPAAQPLIYGPEQRAALAELADIDGPVIAKTEWPQHLDMLADVEVVFSGWGAPLMDGAFLRATPKLRAVFYGAGTVRPFVTEAFWERGIVLTSAYAANAIPVAEYTLATVLLSLRHFWQRAAAARCGEGWGDHTRDIPGSFHATVGLVSYGAIARKVAEHLKAFDMRVMVYCPFLTEAEASKHGVEKVSLADLFRRADIVSVHAPLLSETHGLVNGGLVASMKPGATLINTARGKILAQREVEQVLRGRPDLYAVLDVTEPEPPTANDPLFTLPNVTVTSHIAGSHGRDCHRLGHFVVEDFKNYLAGRPLLWAITRAMAQSMA